ncbi:Lrp/AsnC family transcriptional regulator [Flavobacteriaceae bacterium]|jgi:Lrp/AsnC family leucine-responsive transcriptional regulator|nr:Lrp/AsnC family transcriptional regulator [Flavobacteriaceae bacterium]MDC1199784.1 Lrp/AsnC family transcriptional regulator [Flavobacteriaceae bacterium]|tara:strand:+ start:666 stop:1124 length:459 start_codon:yes stop_codon:yes gene_type:complete
MYIDSLNWNILNLLQQNARISNAAIGRKVGISSPAVSERIKKMEDAGLILGYKTIVSPFKADYQLKAIITLRAFMGKLKPFLTKVKTYDQVINCYRITGNENIVMEVVLKNQKQLEGFIDELIVYGETKTQIVLSHVVAHNPIKSLAQKIAK